MYQCGAEVFTVPLFLTWTGHTKPYSIPDVWDSPYPKFPICCQYPEHKTKMSALLSNFQTLERAGCRGEHLGVASNVLSWEEASWPNQEQGPKCLKEQDKPLGHKNPGPRQPSRHCSPTHLNTHMLATRFQWPHVFPWYLGLVLTLVTIEYLASSPLTLVATDCLTPCQPG